MRMIAVTALCLLLSAAPAAAQTVTPIPVTPVPDDLPFSIRIDAVEPPTDCHPTGWSIRHERITTHAYNPADVRRYYVQYIDDDLVFVDYWGSGFLAYIQDYWVPAERDPNAGMYGSYLFPWWTDSYTARSIEYILYNDQVIWEVRATVVCTAGAVAEFSLTSRPVTDLTPDDLPPPPANLVLAGADIPLYRDRRFGQQAARIGTIERCQTFYASDAFIPRASISAYVTESIANTVIRLFDGQNRLDIVDVPEDYGQPGGGAHIAACAESAGASDV